MVSIKNFYNKHKKQINIMGIIIYLIIYATISISVGLKHEHWSDEAQSWLIARDNNILGILKRMRYEGTPALWCIFLKILICLNVQYNQLCFVTTGLTLIGIIFLFKNKNLPTIIKCLIPYTYFIFFEYTIVARSYSMLFSILMIIAYLYPKKEEHLFKYGIMVFLLMNVSLHGTLIAGGLWLEFLINEIIKSNEISKIERKKKIFFITEAIFFICVIIQAFPASDCTYGISTEYTSLESFNFLLGAISVSKSNIFTIAIACFLLIMIFICLYSKKKDYNIKNSLILFPNMIFICIILYTWHHIGIIFYCILFAIMTTDYKEEKIKRNVMYVSLMIIIFIQIFWSIACSINDYQCNYSPCEDVSEYLKEVGIENKKIYGATYYCIGINAYFDENIFSNFKCSYYSWKSDEYYASTPESFINEELDGDIYIIPDYIIYKYIRKRKKRVYRFM